MEETTIPPLDPPYEPATQALLTSMMPKGKEPLLLFRTIAHNPRVLERFKSGSLLDRGSISLREREIIIDRTTARCGSEYEWGVHIAFFGARAEFTDAQIRATVKGEAADSAWNEHEGLLIRLVDELHDTSTLGDDLLTQLRQHWSDAQLIEMLVLVGFYHTVSFVTNGARVPLEDGAARFPSD